MLCAGVAARQRYGMCIVHCVECDSIQLTVHIPYLDMLPHQRVTYNDVVFFLPNFKLNITLVSL